MARCSSATSGKATPNGESGQILRKNTTPKIYLWNSTGVREHPFQLYGCRLAKISLSLRTNQERKDLVRYEYVSMVLPHDPTDLLYSQRDAEMKSLGWRRVWADITIDSAFLVYRREVRPKR